MSLSPSGRYASLNGRSVAQSSRVTAAMAADVCLTRGTHVTVTRTTLAHVDVSWYHGCGNWLDHEVTVNLTWLFIIEGVSPYS
jgi:hypothetical protein